MRRLVEFACRAQGDEDVTPVDHSVALSADGTRLGVGPQPAGGHL